MAREIGRRAAQHVRHRHQLARDQARVLQLVRASYRDIEALLDQIDAAIVQPQVKRQLRIATEELRNRIGQLRQRQRHRRADTQRAGRLALHRTERAVGLVQVVKDLCNLRVVLLAGLGQTQPARGAVEQPRRQMRFQLADILADRGGGQAKPPRRRGKAVALDDFPKYAQRRQMVHGRFRPRLFTASKYCGEHIAYFNAGGPRLILDRE